MGLSVLVSAMIAIHDPGFWYLLLRERPAPTWRQRLSMYAVVAALIGGQVLLLERFWFVR